MTKEQAIEQATKDKIQNPKVPIAIILDRFSETPENPYAYCPLDAVFILFHAAKIEQVI